MLRTHQPMNLKNISMLQVEHSQLMVPHRQTDTQTHTQYPIAPTTYKQTTRHYNQVLGNVFWMFLEEGKFLFLPACQPIVSSLPKLMLTFIITVICLKQFIQALFLWRVNESANWLDTIQFNCELNWPLLSPRSLAFWPSFLLRQGLCFCGWN